MPSEPPENLRNGHRRLDLDQKPQATPAETEHWRGRAHCALQRELGERYAWARVQMRDFELYHPNQRQVIDWFTHSDNLRCLVQDGQNLIFFGPVGTAKDRLMAYAGYRAIDYLQPSADDLYSGVMPVHYLSGQEFYGRLRDLMDSEFKDDTEARYMHELAAPLVLMISDPHPPYGKMTDFQSAQLYRVIDRRYRLERSTWITINAASVSEVEGKLTTPVFDRLRQDATLIFCNWPSYRERRQTRIGIE